MHRAVEPLTPLAVARALTLLLDVDSMCARLNGRLDRQLIHTLRLLARAEVQIVLVSTRAHELAESLHVDIEGAWWCDRVLGWQDGETRSEGSQMSFALVIAQLRQRMPAARLLAVSDDPLLRAALDGDDRTIAIEPVSDTDRIDFGASPKRLLDALWCVIEIRTCRQKEHRR